MDAPAPRVTIKVYSRAKRVHFYPTPVIASGPGHEAIPYYTTIDKNRTLNRKQGLTFSAAPISFTLESVIYSCRNFSPDNSKLFHQQITIPIPFPLCRYT